MNPIIEPITLHWVNILQIVFLSTMLFGVCLLRRQAYLKGLQVFLGIHIPLMLLNFSEELGLRGEYLLTPLFTLASGPAFFIFIDHLIHKRQKLDKKQFIHFCGVLVGIPVMAHPQLVIALGSVSLIIYAFVVLKRVAIYHLATENMTSQASDYHLRWLFVVIYIVIFLGLTDLVRLNLQPVLSYELMNTWYFFHQLMVLITFSYLILQSVAQKHVFAKLAQFESWQQVPAPKESDEARSIYEQISMRIENERLYLQPRLSLRDVAKKCDLQEKDISWAFNQGGEVTFNDFINQLRFEYFLQHRHQISRGEATILDLALASGFNSKSTFNTAFKKKYEKTPSRYLAELDESDQRT